MAGPTSTRVETSGATLAVRQYAGDGEPIVLLHGGPGLGDYLGPVAELLSPPHWVVSYDQRGCGDSSRAASYHFRDHVEDLDALRQHLAVDQLHLFGNSWGGLLAQLYAKTYPQHVASLVLAGSIANTGKKFAALEQRLLKERLVKPVTNPAALVWMLVSRVPGLEDFGYQRLMRIVYPYYFARRASAPPWTTADRIRKRSGDATMRSLYAADDDYLAQVPLAAPVLLLYGRQDTFREVQAVLADRFPQARSVWIEEAGHFGWLEQPAAFRAALLSFYSA